MGRRDDAGGSAILTQAEEYAAALARDPLADPRHVTLAAPKPARSRRGLGLVAAGAIAIIVGIVLWQA
ncbi:hypothetical protein [Pontivivens ytuae]|uniref:Uncharacterized protein n=1 Tax=Pontivivens ytuae TaxID=2789856 RepID=A0A7S9LV13_9RHOB|nr:hypothetical protein [Pontivivens ytuae]QPH55691.1 hypothetical protein I0K15_08185 [Pontivivens ytuae]